MGRTRRLHCGDSFDASVFEKAVARAGRFRGGVSVATARTSGWIDALESATSADWSFGRRSSWIRFFAALNSGPATTGAWWRRRPQARRRSRHPAQ
jgi:hypothetical protein